MNFLTLKTQLKPVFKAACTSGVLLSCGDVVTQVVQRQRSKEQKLDLHRTLRFTAVGLTLHGPYFYFAFKAIDTLGASLGSNLRAAVLKSCTSQVTVFPVYVAAFYGYMGLLEGKTVEEAIVKIQTAFPPTFATGALFWPAANVINFMYVPAKYRVAYINIMGIAWTSYLSWLNSREGRLVESATT